LLGRKKGFKLNRVHWVHIEMRCDYDGAGGGLAPPCAATRASRRTSGRCGPFPYPHDGLAGRVVVAGQLGHGLPLLQSPACLRLLCDGQCRRTAHRLAFRTRSSKTGLSTLD